MNGIAFIVTGIGDFKERGIQSIASLILFALAVCGWFQPLSLAQTTLCGRQPAVPVGDGAYNVQSNEFNSRARECIRVNGVGFAVTESAISSGGPGAYPLIYKGCHWGKCTLNSGLPVQVSTLSSLRSNWSTRQPESGDYVTAYDIWFNTTPATSGRPDAAELMVWLNHTPGMRPAGEKTASGVRIGGAAYDLWERRGDSGNYIAYVRTRPIASVSNLDLKALLRDAMGRGYLRSEWYLISIEAGFELWKGGAGLETTGFSATVKNTLGEAVLNIWWPKAKAVLAGTQPFKARLANVPVDAYQMYWSVDGGKLNSMANDSTDMRHKEASVDFSSWKWREAGRRYGPFNVTFTAKDLSGEVVREKTISVYVAK
ncbi:MAG TPA: hypothetical protein VNW97_07940 [Candidatus Saccharimonadales bacterium]|nr:hypothetical protein [Candidatus Saccharimonadales bacterium]